MHAFILFALLTAVSSAFSVLAAAAAYGTTGVKISCDSLACSVVVYIKIGALLFLNVLLLPCNHNAHNVPSRFEDIVNGRCRLKCD